MTLVVVITTPYGAIIASDGRSTTVNNGNKVTHCENSVKIQILFNRFLVARAGKYSIEENKKIIDTLADIRGNESETQNLLFASGLISKNIKRIYETDFIKNQIEQLKNVDLKLLVVGYFEDNPKIYKIEYPSFESKNQNYSSDRKYIIECIGDTFHVEKVVAELGNPKASDMSLEEAAEVAKKIILKCADYCENEEDSNGYSMIGRNVTTFILKEDLIEKIV